MADVTEIYARQVDGARLALARGDRSGAAEWYRSAVDTARGDDRLQRELISALVHLGKLEQELLRPADAERRLDEALALGEGLYGADHPSLGAVLNELGRLHIRRSNHARARMVLERLLRITRTKGEDHADVATALAGLAVAHRGLGDHAAAEGRYRDALRIREKVLAPDHMAIVVTLEQLSETCAARGNLPEAIALLKRALPTREAALGADHATACALRSRITDLELRSVAARVGPSVATPAPVAVEPAAPAEPPRRSKELVFLYQPEPPVRRRATLARERVTTPVFSAAVTSAAVTTTALVTTSPVPAPVTPVAPVALALPTKPAIVERSSIATRQVSFGRPLAMYSFAGLAGVALVVAALTSLSGSGTRSEDVAPTPVAEQPPATVAAAIVVKASVPTPAPAKARKADSLVVPELPTLPAAPKRLAAISVPIIAMSNVDSLVRASAGTNRAASADQIGPSGGLRTSPMIEDAASKPPVLIGPAPTIYFPDALRSQRTTGETVVRFRVDERGVVDVASLKVVKSDHELFTNAVRSVLPRFRFEPARSGGADPKPRADWVNFRAEFNSKL
jgi:TonB family protein